MFIVSNEAYGGTARVEFTLQENVQYTPLISAYNTDGSDLDGNMF